MRVLNGRVPNADGLLMCLLRVALCLLSVTANHSVLTQFRVYLQSQQLAPGKQTRNGKPYEEQRSQASAHLGTYHPPRPNTHEHLSCAYQQEIQSTASLLS